MMELFLNRIFQNSGLQFDWGAKIEGGKLPDFDLAWSGFGQMHKGAMKDGEVSVAIKPVSS